MSASLKISSLVYVGTEMDRDLRTEFRIRCIRLDKVAAIADMLQHECKDLGLPRDTVDSFESLFPICEIKRIADSSE